MEHVVSQLITKRAELNGELEHLLEKVQYLKETVNAIDISIKAFDPNFKVENIKNKKFRKQSHIFKRGESNKLVLDVLRTKKEPQTIRQITKEVMKLKKFDTEDNVLCTEIENRLRYSITNNTMLTVVQEEGELKKWKVAS